MEPRNSSSVTAATEEPWEATSATTKVLETYELLETILAHLPPHDRLLVQAVSQQWQSLINRSATLQRLLYLHPTGEGDKVDSLNSLIMSSAYTQNLGGTVGTTKLIFRLGMLRAMLASPNGSWKQMFITQPAMQKITYKLSGIGPVQVLRDPEGIRFGQLIEQLRQDIAAKGRMINNKGVVVGECGEVAVASNIQLVLGRQNDILTFAFGVR